MFVEDFKKFVLEKGFVLFDEKNANKYIDCATEAFYDYPLMRDIFDNDIYDRAYRAYMKLNFSKATDDCVTFADSADVNGFCVAGKPFLSSVVDTSFYNNNYLKVEGNCKYKHIKNIIDFQRYCVEVKYKYTSGDAIHCVFLCVKKDMQGKGIGKKLLLTVHEFAKMINKPVFLDTHKPVNVDIYKHLGYELKSTVPYKGGSTNHNALVYYPERDNNIKKSSII